MTAEDTADMDTSTPRLLGAAFLFQALASLVWSVLFKQLIVPDDVVASMTNVAGNIAQVRVTIVLAMVTALGVSALGALLFVALKRRNEKVALVALVLYLVEATILAVSRIPAYSLIRISQESAAAGHPVYLQTLANLCIEAADFGDWLHMLPFAVGAVLFYSLFVKSRFIPRALAVLGLAAATLAVIGTSLELLGYPVPIIVVALNFPFEVGVGLWLAIKGSGETGAAT
jgi:uncharacterized protein DUF4386